MKLKKLLKNNTFLVNSCICLVVLLMICYLGISSPIKKTYSADTTCNGDWVLTEDGNTVCITSSGEVLTGEKTIYGLYKLKDTLEVHDDSYGFNLEFTANNVDYEGIIYKNMFSEPYIQYETEGGTNRTMFYYKYNGLVAIDPPTFDRYSDYANEYSKTIYVKTPQTPAVLSTFSNGDYEWFVGNFEKLNNCYYSNTESGESVVWTNVPLGEKLSTVSYNTKENCDNARYIKLYDSLNGMVKMGQNYNTLNKWKSKGDKFTIDSLLNANNFHMEKTGYTFKGWNIKADGTGASYTNASEVDLQTNLTLYAQWKVHKYTIKYDANGGTGTMADQVVNYDASVQLRNNTFTKEGYKFVGWLYNGELYSNRHQIVNLTATDGAELVFTAAWMGLDTYSITYNANTTDSVTNMPALTTKVVGETVKIASSIPLRNGYTFAGWYDNKDATGSVYEANSNYSLNADLVLYAKWIKPFEVDDAYKVDEEKGYIIISEPTSKSVFVSKFTLSSDFTLDVETNGEGAVFTGGAVEIKSANGVYKTYKTVVLGDVSGDGELTYRDYILVYNHIKKLKDSSSSLKLLENEKLVAGNISGDGVINYQDYVLIYNEIVK